MSTRGHTEAFARRLQSRLKTLSHDNEVPPDTDSAGTSVQANSTTAINGQTESQVPTLEPLKISTNYDYIETESPASPVDEVSQASCLCGLPSTTQTSGDKVNTSTETSQEAECSNCPQESIKVSQQTIYPNTNLMPVCITSPSTELTPSSQTTDKLNGHLKTLPLSEPTNLTLIKTEDNSETPSTKVGFQTEGGELDEDKHTLTKYCTSKTKFIRYNEDEDDDEEVEKENVENEECIEEEEEIEEPLEEDPNNNAVEAEPELTQVPEKVDEKAQDDDMSNDEEFERPRRVQRSSSLKSGKTPPGTPGRKKFVRFADVLGLDLADVRTFLDEVPKVPKSAFEDLEITTTSVDPVNTGPPLEKVLIPLFQQPGAMASFLDKVRDKQVCLENAAVTDPVSCAITGTVRVRNLDFHKSVHIRYSIDDWRSYSDLTGTYVENSCDGFSDKFTFILFGNSLQIGQRLEIAIRFQAKGEQFWDNNYGTNYCFQCMPCNVAATAVKETVNINPPPSNSISSIDLPHRQWENAFLY